MKRIVHLCSLLLVYSLICSVAETFPGRGQPDVNSGSGVAFAQSGAWKTCPFSIIGAWRVEGGTKRAQALLYEFNPSGVIVVSERTDDALADGLIPREYEVIGGGKYALDNPEAPKRIDFNEMAMDKRGVIPRGETSLAVVEYGDDSFVTVDERTQALTKWFRTQTRRCFLTFAARGGHSPSAFAMWTALDGRHAKIEALGLRTENPGGEAPIFGLIPDQLYREFENESGKASDAMFRLELTEAEFERSHKAFETWAEYARTSKLPHADPYLNGMEFLKSAAENLNQCEEKLKLDKTAGAVDSQNAHQRIMEYVRMLRKKNKESHVTDGMFPADWRPAPLVN